VTAQEVVGHTVDRIVAIVGDTPIPQSVLDQQEQTFLSQSEQQPVTPEERRQLRAELLNAIVDQELFIQAAERDTMIQITEEEIQASVDEIVRNLRNQYPSMLDLQNELQQVGFVDLDDYRVWLGEQQRRELLQEAILQQLQATGEIENRPPTDDELRDYYEENLAQFGTRPATISFRQIVVFTKPDTSALAAAIVEADSVRRKLRDGADFAEMARIHSDDPASKDIGGELGWFRRGQGMQRDFEEAAFRLQPGFISIPIYTPFGFHLIEVIRSEPASVQARHILIAPTVTLEDQQRARARADSAARMLRDGVPIDSVERRFHEPDEERILTDIPRDGLPDAYKAVVADAIVGDVLGPVDQDSGNNRITFTVVLLQDMRPEGPVSFDDVRDQLRSNMGRQAGIQRYLQKLRDATFIEIRL
jgi:parvulin-like peptidyl-prolyl isomerase